MSGSELLAIICGAATWILLTVSYAGLGAASANWLDASLLILQSLAQLLVADYRSLCKERPHVAWLLVFTGLATYCLLIGLWDHSGALLCAGSQSSVQSQALISSLLQTDRNVQEKATVVSDTQTWVDKLKELDWLTLLAYAARRGITLLFSFGVQLGLYRPSAVNHAQHEAQASRIPKQVWHGVHAGDHGKLSVLGLQRETMRHRGVIEDEPTDSDYQATRGQQIQTPAPDRPAPSLSVLGLQHSSIKHRGVVEDEGDLKQGRVESSVSTAPQQVSAASLGFHLTTLGFQQKSVRQRAVVEDTDISFNKEGATALSMQRAVLEETPLDENIRDSGLRPGELAADLSVLGLQRKSVRQRAVIKDLDVDVSVRDDVGESSTSLAPHKESTGVSNNSLGLMKGERNHQQSTWHLNDKELAPDVSVFGLQRKIVRHRSAVEEPVDFVDVPSSTSETHQYLKTYKGNVDQNAASVLGLQRSSSRCKAQLVTDDN